MNRRIDLAAHWGAAALALSFVIASCSSSEEAAQAADEQGASGTPEPQLVAGPCAGVFGGQVCTFATLVGDRVTEFGATVPMTTVEGAPPGGDMVWPPQAAASIPLPDEVRSNAGFDHLGVNWEALGHPPGLFFTPHFDFHFFTVTPEAVAAVDCSDTAKPAAIPAGYALPDLDVPPIGMLVGLCVPLMGMHAMPASEVDEVEPFSASMLIGYYDGEFTFVEPMVSSALLLERESFDLEMPETPGIPAGVRFPTVFHASYDEASQSYRLTFSGLASE